MDFLVQYLIETYQSAYDTLGGGLYIILIAFTFIGVVAQWSLYEKCDQPGVACIVPVWNVIVFLRIVGRPAWQLFLLLIPIYNIYFFFKVFIEICQCFGKRSWIDYFLVVVLNAPYIIYLGLSPENEYKGPLYKDGERVVHPHSKEEKEQKDQQRSGKAQTVKG